MDKETRHSMDGCIVQNGQIYIPLSEVIKICFRFPTLTGKQLMLLLEDAQKRLAAKLPKEEEKKIVKKSFWRKFFE